MFVFAFANLFFTLARTQVDMIAEVGDYRSRLILALIHPLAALSSIVLVFLSKPRPLLTFVTDIWRRSDRLYILFGGTHYAAGHDGCCCDCGSGPSFLRTQESREA